MAAIVSQLTVAADLWSLIRHPALLTEGEGATEQSHSHNPIHRQTDGFFTADRKGGMQPTVNE